MPVLIGASHWPYSDSVQDDQYNGMPEVVSDDEDQESVNGTPIFEVQDDGIFEYMHNINLMAFPDEVIRVNKQIGQVLRLRNVVRGPIEPIVPQLESWAVSDNGAYNLYVANDIWIQHGKYQRVNTCRRTIRPRRVGVFLYYV